MTGPTLSITLATAAASGVINLWLAGTLPLLGGGVPMSVDSDVIGIGVAGSGGAATDERCATAAIAQGLAPAGARR
jgi:uncharacterized protein GlcG (DUF336 family)